MTEISKKLVGIRIPSDKVFYFIVAVGHLFDQVTVHAIPVQVRISALIANKAEIFGIELNALERVAISLSEALVSATIIMLKYPCTIVWEISRMLT